MKALIDADILLYRIGFTTENEDQAIAQWRMEDLINRILEDVSASSFVLYLSDSTENGFRYKLTNTYKATRTQPKPLHYAFLKQYLIDEWNAEVQVGQEADDALGIAQCSAEYEGNGFNQQPSTIICSIDKDLLQIPGHHYNFVTNSFTFIDEDMGLNFFYKQMLIGDPVDNIKGVTGIGKAKADKILGEETNELVLFERVRDTYKAWLQKEWEIFDDEWTDFHEKQMNNIILLTGRLLKIRTKENEVWHFPEGSNITPETTPVLESTE